MFKILVVNNGDKRQKYLIDYLRKQHIVEEIKDELSLFYEINDKKYNCLVLPVRGLKNEFVIDGTDIKLTENYLKLMSNKIIFTGLINSALRKNCSKYNVELYSYLNNDLAIKNNYITVEGIIEAIAKNSHKAIFNSNILIIGYGKLGQISAKVLKNMKADITISARNNKDLLSAKINEYKTIKNNQLLNYIDKYDFIINTVPYRLISVNNIIKLKDKENLIIDVASEPFGLDHDIAKLNSVKTLKLPGIPGKTAPKTSGDLIGEVIDKYLKIGDINE